MKIVGISGTIIGSKTAVLVDAILKEINKMYPEYKTELLDLRKYEMEFCDGRNPELYNNDTKELIKIVSEADVYIIGFPIFNASFPAPLKNIFDLLPPAVFRYKVMGFVANGGTNQHYLVIENQMKPIAGYFRSYVAPSYVYVNSSQYNERNEIVDEEIVERIKVLAEELINMQKALGKN